MKHLFWLRDRQPDLNLEIPTAQLHRGVRGPWVHNVIKGSRPYEEDLSGGKDRGGRGPTQKR